LGSGGGGEDHPRLCYLGAGLSPSPANLGSNPADTYMSHGGVGKGLQPKLLPCTRKVPLCMWAHPVLGDEECMMFRGFIRGQ